MRRILLAYDGGKPAQRALEMAADLAGTYGATVIVVNVTPRQARLSPTDPWDDREEGQRALLDAAMALRQRGVEPELVESFGDPATAIERVAAERGADIVIVGTRDLGALGRFVQGSVSEHVATHAPTTVIVAR